LAWVTAFTSRVIKRYGCNPDRLLHISLVIYVTEQRRNNLFSADHSPGDDGRDKARQQESDQERVHRIAAAERASDDQFLDDGGPGQNTECPDAMAIPRL